MLRVFLSFRAMKSIESVFSLMTFALAKSPSVKKTLALTSVLSGETGTLGSTTAPPDCTTDVADMNALMYV